MQGYLRNPLADPGLFGVAPGAALGAVASFWFGYSASPILLPLFALIAAGLDGRGRIDLAVSDAGRPRAPVAERRAAQRRHQRTTA